MSSPDLSRDPERPPRVRCALLAVTAALALLGTASSHALAAAGDPAALGWVRAPGAESCIGAVDLAKAVEKRLGRAALAPLAGAKVSIEGRIAKAPDASGYSVSLTVADATGKVLGTRSLSRETPDCRAMDDDIVLTVALLVDPEAPLSAPLSTPLFTPPATATLQTATLQSPPVPQSTSAPSTPSPISKNTSSSVSPPGACPSAIPAASGPPDKPSSPAERWGAAFFVGPAVSLGALPNVGVGAQLRALIAPVPWF